MWSFNWYLHIMNSVFGRKKVQVAAHGQSLEYEPVYLVSVEESEYLLSIEQGVVHDEDGIRLHATG